MNNVAMKNVVLPHTKSVGIIKLIKNIKTLKTSNIIV